MERPCEICEIGWLPNTLAVVSFLRVVFEAYNISCHGGFILVADDFYQEKLFKNEFVKALQSGIKSDLKSYKKLNLENNYSLVVVTATNDFNKESIDRFLENENFFPVLVTGRVLPKEFREGYLVFRVKEDDIAYVSTKEFSAHVDEMKHFIIENIGSICQSLKLLDTSSDIERVSEVRYKNLWKLFLAVCEVYRLFYRTHCGENYEKEFRKRYITTGLSYIQKISDFADGMDVSTVLTEAIFDCVDLGLLKLAIDVNEIEKGNLPMFDTGAAVFYDEEFYYFSEQGLRRICEQLLELMSWLELKQLMAENGLIERVESGFTTKKTFVINGSSERIRVMKVHREALMSESRTDMLEAYIQDRKEQSYE